MFDLESMLLNVISTFFSKTISYMSKTFLVRCTWPKPPQLLLHHFCGSFWNLCYFWLSPLRFYLARKRMAGDHFENCFTFQYISVLLITSKSIVLTAKSGQNHFIQRRNHRLSEVSETFVSLMYFQGCSNLNFISTKSTKFAD